MLSIKRGVVFDSFDIPNAFGGAVVSMASTLLLVIVLVLDLIAFALAVAAEQRRNTVCLLSLSPYFLFFYLFNFFFFPLRTVLPCICSGVLDVGWLVEVWDSPIRFNSVLVC